MKLDLGLRIPKFLGELKRSGGNPRGHRRPSSSCAPCSGPADRWPDQVSVIRAEHVAVRADEGVSGPGFEFRSGHKGATAEIFEE